MEKVITALDIVPCTFGRAGNKMGIIDLLYIAGKLFCGKYGKDERRECDCIECELHFNSNYIVDILCDRCDFIINVYALGDIAK